MGSQRAEHDWAANTHRHQYTPPNFVVIGDSDRESRAAVSGSLWPRGLCSPWSSPGQNTGVGSLSLLQGIFLTQGWNPGLPHCRRILYQLSHKGSPYDSMVSVSFSLSHTFTLLPFFNFNLSFCKVYIIYTVYFHFLLSKSSLIIFAFYLKHLDQLYIMWLLIWLG